MPDRYRKKPVEIDAMRFDDHAELDAWLAAELGRERYMFLVSPDRISLHIDTLEGRMVAHPGDWVIRGVAGEFYPCRADIFDATYDLVDPLDELHLIEFRDDGWTIQHTLTERIAGTLFDCPLSNWTGGDPEVRGRFVLNDDHTIGEAVDG